MKRRTNVPSPVDSINTLVEQLQQTDSSVEDGEVVWVRSTQCLWVYRVNSGLTPNGTDVVASLYGNGVWVRSNLTLGSSGDLLQTSWFIDPANGNDGNDGTTLATALKTDAERQRRWGLNARVVQNTTVTYANSPPASDPVNYDAQVLTGVSLTVSGTPVVGATGTITAQTTLNRATQTPQDITAAALGVAGDVGTLIEITGGTAGNIGAYARVAKVSVLGAAVRTGPFGKANVPWAALGASWTPVTPVAGVDTYRQLTPTVLQVGTWNFSGGDNTAYQGASHAPFVLVDNLNLTGNVSAGTVAGPGILRAQGSVVVYLKRSISTRVLYAGEAAITHAGGGIDGSQLVSLSVQSNAFGFVALGTPALTCTTGRFSLAQNALFQDSQLQLSGNAQIRNGGIAFFDKAGATPALQVLAGASMRGLLPSGGDSDLIWGDNNNVANVAVTVGAYAVIAYGTKPTINPTPGATHQSTIGGTNKDWAAVPFIEPANNAGIVVLA